MPSTTWMRLANELRTNRREFILAGGALAALPWLGQVAAEERDSRPVFSADPFPLGVASGDPDSQGVVLWTRLAPSPLVGGALPAIAYDVRWEIAEDEAMHNIVQQGIAIAVPQLGHSVHVEVNGLKPDRWYWYRFSCGDARSRVGRTRTLPQRNAMPAQLRFAFASCQHFEQGLFTAYEHMAQEELDLVLHLGDYIYEMAGRENLVRKHLGAELSSLDDYRNRYAQYRLDPHLQTMHARCPWLVVWDDHEFDNNCAGAISEEKDVDSATYLLRRANAYQAYYEHMPLRRRSLPAGPDMRLYRRIRFGRLAQFQMLDTRQYRTDQPNGDGNKPLTGGVFDPQGTLLGPDQEKWLMAGLLNSPVQWNVLAQQLMMARVDRVAGTDALYSMDQWAGYDVARKRLLHFLAERRVPNPIILGGDIHSNWVNDLKLDFDRPDEASVATEFIGTSISSGGNGSAMPKGLAELLSENPFVRFHNTQRGYVSCTVTPREWKSDYQVVEFVDRPGAPRTTGASFVVEAGVAGAKSV